MLLFNVQSRTFWAVDTVDIHVRDLYTVAGDDILNVKPLGHCILILSQCCTVNGCL